MCINPIFVFSLLLVLLLYNAYHKHTLSYMFFQTGEVIPMPVPSSYNDITQNKTLRDFVGWAWYETEFYVPTEWLNRRVVLRFDSAHYNTIVVGKKRVLCF